MYKMYDSTTITHQNNSHIQQPHSPRPNHGNERDMHTYQLRHHRQQQWQVPRLVSIMFHHSAASLSALSAASASKEVLRQLSSTTRIEKRKVTVKGVLQVLAMMEDKGVKCIHSPLESSRSTPEIDVLKHLGTSKLVLRQEK